MTRQVCSAHGCPELVPCRIHEPISSRNHRGVRRQARGHGAEHDRAARTFRAEGRACQLRLSGCTGRAESSDYSVPGDWTSARQPACLHCQRAQGAMLARAAR